MPKRKHSDHYDHVLRKIRRLERRLLRKGRKRRYDSDGSSPPLSPLQASEHSSFSQEIENAVMLSDAEDVSAELPAFDDMNEQTGQNALPVNTVLSVVQVPSVVQVSAVPGPTTRNPVPEAVNSTATSSTATTAPPASPPAAAAPVLNPESATPVIEDLDSDLLEILGIDPTAEKKYGKDIQKDLSVRLEHCATIGLTKELRKELKEKYLTPANCKLIDPPALNAEIKAAVSDITVKRDKAIEGKQSQLASAITCLGEAITTLLSSKEKDTALLKLLMDAARLICDCQHADTVTRRKFLLSSVKNVMKEQIQNTKIDKFLFGENFAETLKSAKAITKSGADLKSPAPKIPSAKNKKFTVNTNSSNSKNLNWRNPGPSRRQSGPPRTKEPATTSTRIRLASSSRTSQHQQQRSTNNRR